MPKLPPPPPPEALSGIPPDLQPLRAGTLLWRVHFRGGGHPGDWNRFRDYGPIPGSRFDHHEPPPHRQDRAILYAASEITTCLAEIFQDRRAIYPLRDDPWLAGFLLARGVKLLDLTGSWPTRAGASMAISTGSRRLARAWSRAIHQAYPDVWGLWYPSSMHANRPAVALFERAQTSLPETPLFHRSLADALLAPALELASAELGYVLT